ncbi:MAG: PepSY domain-containing protein [Limisphaerales bacterium]
MKIKTIIVSLLATALCASLSFTAQAKDEKELEAKAKISKADAEKTALEKVPGGKIKEGEIEEENGKLIWSFDITTEGTKDITEVHVDANTGAVLETKVESAEEEKAEAKEEKKEKKEGKDKDDDDKDEKK